MQFIGQFRSVVTVWGAIDEGFHGGQQRPVPGKSDGFMRPQTAIVKAGDLGQSVEAPAMRIAGVVIEQLEFAEYSQRGVCAEDPFQFGEVGDLVSAEVLAESSGIEGGGAHYVIVPTRGASFQREL